MLPLLLAMVVLGADFFSKYWINQNLPLMFSFPHYPYGGIAVFKDWGGVEFSISHLTNKGAAWGTLSDYQGWLVITRIVLIIALIIYVLYWNKQISWRYPLALIIAGAIGNVIDYYLYGHVVDMFHFILWGYDFPVFNVADTAVSIGVIWMIILNIFQKEEPEVSA